MSYAAGLLDPSDIRGIAALSGYVPIRSALPLRWNELRNLQVFISHGTYDELIPVSLSKASAELLKNAGASVHYREYPMGHEISQETLNDLASWFEDVLKQPVGDIGSPKFKRI